MKDPTIRYTVYSSGIYKLKWNFTGTAPKNGEAAIAQIFRTETMSKAMPSILVPIGDIYKLGGNATVDGGIAPGMIGPGLMRVQGAYDSYYDIYDMCHLCYTSTAFVFGATTYKDVINYDFKGCKLFWDLTGMVNLT